MKKYNVYVYFFLDRIHDCYTVYGRNPYEAKEEALARIFIETNYDFDDVEIEQIVEIEEVKPL